MEVVQQAYEACAEQYIELFGSSAAVHHDDLALIVRHLTIRPRTVDVGSLHDLGVPDSSVAGILAWYSLIHVSPDEIDSLLIELRRALPVGGMLVTGFFNSNRITPFEHKVATAYSWPIDELSDRLRRAGFVEVERQCRPAVTASAIRSQAAIALTAE